MYIPLHDFQGNVIALLDSDNHLLESYSYTPFGVYTGPPKPLSPWLFSFARLDPESELYYFHNRYYDPNSHTWITPDPLGTIDSINPYQYCFNNPFRYRDPNGLTAMGISYGLTDGVFSVTGDFLGFFAGVGFATCTSVYRLCSSDHVWMDIKQDYARASSLVHDGTCVVLNMGTDILDRMAEKEDEDYKATVRITKFVTEAGVTVYTGYGIIKSLPSIARASLQVCKQGSKIVKPTARAGKTISRIKGSSNGFLGRRGWNLQNAPYQPVRNYPMQLTGRQYTAHALDQMQNRGITSRVVENVISHGTIRPNKVGSNMQFYDSVNNITVVLNDKQNVVTVTHGVIR